MARNRIPAHRRVDVDRLKIDDYRAALKDLLDYEETISGITVGRANLEGVHYVHAITGHCVNLVRAGELLLGTPQEQAVMVLARSALELSVFAQWTVRAEKGVDLLQQRVQAERLRTMWKVQKASAVRQGKPLESDTGRPPLPAEIESFSKLSANFKEQHELDLLYSLLSGYVHPSSALINSYLAWNPEQPESGAQALVRFPALGDGSTAAVHALLLSTTYSLYAFESLRKHKPNLPKIKSIVARVGLEPILHLK